MSFLQTQGILQESIGRLINLLLVKIWNPQEGDPVITFNKGTYEIGVVHLQMLQDS